ncbi:enterobactin ABC transporter permease [Cellulomonas shaoxiangyii]|uniref:Enterobactin ABC transporter permease n=1 Tax=Cellulomonas shaoxiangyii TaxID=2566013 RepID=A0A4P7SME6_9CELL|nr:enterobactin ABC transporter permease [Cellulomonas shaoxiangyii]TGY84781.1 enterobactin ABC transporter permease [Cellulomonas shaoxiangyii]
MPGASRRRPHPARVLLLLAAVLALGAVAFLTVGATGSWAFVLPFRATKLASLAVVGTAVAVATVLFQTVTANRILTPSLLGMDAMFALVQTVLVFVLGGAALAALDATTMFVGQVAVMVVCSVALFGWLFGGRRRSLHLLLLVGVVLGTLLRAASSMLQRVMDPNEFAVLTNRLFASFNTIDDTLLGVTAALVAAGCAVAWRRRRALDVLALGREAATGLGVPYRRTVLEVLVVVAVLVSASTALVGPVTFLGLLVANVAYVVLGTHEHRWLLPGAALVSVLFLVAGQVVLEHALGFATSLGVVIELVGGLVFLVLLLRGAAR